MPYFVLSLIFVLMASFLWLLFSLGQPPNQRSCRFFALIDRILPRLSIKLEAIGKNCPEISSNRKRFSERLSDMGEALANLVKENRDFGYVGLYFLLLTGIVLGMGGPYRSKHGPLRSKQIVTERPPQSSAEEIDKNRLGGRTQTGEHRAPIGADAILDHDSIKRSNEIDHENSHVVIPHKKNRGSGTSLITPSRKKLSQKAS